jgi:hypothetical protein
VIKLQCVCGNVLSLPEQLDGKQVRCKRCNKVLKVHAQAKASENLTDSQRRRLDADLVVQGSRPCPGCGRTYPPSTVICIDCGLNVDSGAMLYASLESSGEDKTKPEERRPPQKATGSLWQRLLRSLGLGRKG